MKTLPIKWQPETMFAVNPVVLWPDLERRKMAADPCPRFQSKPSALKVIVICASDRPLKRLLDT
jgi:hypothetical protein